jgi:hypothetical protein
MQASASCQNKPATRQPVWCINLVQALSRAEGYVILCHANYGCDRMGFALTIVLRGFARAVQ